ncbi:MAG TPA: transglycosylase SLT domain-containing protein [Sphingopyxis sp.]|nr:transglycosylase SLT domain-containing protein [Sphingopyxis sp.]
MQELPSQRFNYSESRNFVGEALQQAGQQLNRVASGWDEVQATYDEAAVKKLAVEVDQRKRELLYTGDDPFFNKQGFDAGDARGDVEARFTELREEAMRGAQNDRQRSMLTNVLEKSFGDSLVDVAKHTTSQLNVEWQKQTEARLAGFQQDAVRLYSDPERYADNIAGGLLEIQGAAERQGWSEERADEAEERFISGVHTSVITGRLTADDIDGALAIFEKYRDDLSFNDAQSIQDKLRPAIQYRQAEDDALIALGSVPTSGPDETPTPGVAADLHTQLKAIESNESGGKQFDKGGRPLTSSAGAIGVMQVMPGTAPEAAALAGLAWDPKRYREDEAYNRALGQAYYKEMLRKFGGDPVKAAAAYNAGPGSAAKGTGVNGAMARARKAGEPDNWIAYLPAETRDYVDKFQKKTGTSVGGSSEARKWDLSAAYTTLEDRAKREGWTPERLERARQRVDEHVRRDEMLDKRRDDSEWDAALGTVDSLGDNFTDVSQIPNFDRLSPDRRVQLRNSADANRRAIATGQEVKANGDTSIILGKLAIEEPDAFLKVDLREYRGKVTAAEYDELQKSQSRISANPAEQKSLLGVVSGAINVFATPDMKLSGERNGLRRNRVANAMLTYLTKNVDPKRLPTDSERRAAFNWAVGEVGGSMRADDEAFDVPAQFINAYGARIKRQTGAWPSNSQIKDAWARSQANQ